MTRAKKARFKNPIDTEAVTDFNAYTESFLEDNPFYPRWPWGRLSKKHMEQMEKDNMWFREMRARKAMDTMEEALF